MRSTKKVLFGISAFIAVLILSWVIGASAAIAQNFPFKIYITKLEQFDDGVDPLTLLGDYYARVTINGAVQNNYPSCGDEITSSGQIYTVPIQLFSNFTRIPECTRGTPWVFEQQVPAGAPVTVRIQVFDSDGGSDDDEGDARPGDGYDINLVVDPATGRWSGDFNWPRDCSRVTPEERNFAADNVNVCWQIGFDSDGDGLLDVWETSGLDSDNDGDIDSSDLNLPMMGANPQHKDLFVELDWMPGNEPLYSNIQEWKQAFAAAPINAGGTANPDGLPGINLWVDTGSLTTSIGTLVGDNLGGGNSVPFTNISNLKISPFYTVRFNNFDASRALVFRYGLNSGQPVNNVGLSTGSNTTTTLNDINKSWLPGEWLEVGPRTVEIISGTGSGQKRTITANTATQLTISEAWSTIPDTSSTYEISLIGGQGEIGGNDFINYNRFTSESSTLMHELGHNLNLGHGGGSGSSLGQGDRNCKPNYVSIMNYDHDRIFRLNGTSVIDFSPPRQVPGGRSTTIPPVLDENALSDSVVLDPVDPDNLFTFVGPGLCRGTATACVLDSDCAANVKCVGTKMLYPLNMAVDWNGNGTNDPGTLELNTDTTGTNGDPAGCANNELITQEGHNDWSNISLPFLHYGDYAGAPINPSVGPEPTLEERIRLNEELNTADLGITQSAPATVEVGDSFALKLTIGNKGPNPALAVQVVDTLPLVTVLSSGTGCTEDPAGTLTCTLSSMLRGAQSVIDLSLGTDGRACVNGLPQPLNNTATVANVAEYAGADPNPADNTSTITVMPVDTTAPVIESVTASPNMLWAPNHKMVPVTLSVVVTDLCDTSPTCRIIGVSSNEVLNAPGDGNTSPDYEVIDPLVVNLRAERSGSGDGRVYTITTECTDASNNTTRASANVAVARDASGQQ